MTRYNAVAVSVQSAKSSYRYGQLARVPLSTGAAEMLFRVNIPADIPTNAVVTKAELVFTAGATWATSKTFAAQRNATAFTTKTTWSTKPALTGSASSLAVASATAYQTTFRIPVTADVQAFVSGSASNYGWRLSITAGTATTVQGSAANIGQPWLDLEYALPGDPPFDLSPAGTVDIATPTLTFGVPDLTTGIQVQLASDSGFTTIVHDSGTVVTDTGVYDLTGHYSVPDLTTIYWRARVVTAGGTSAWTTAQFYRDALPALTITSPGATAGDTTPPITWTFTDQTAWRVLYYENATDELLADSGRTAGTATSWTPPVGVRGPGSTARVVVRTWDSVANRVPTPGDPPYAEAVSTFDVVKAGVAPAPTALTATQRGATPIVDLAWAIGTVPDQWQIVRDGKWIGKVAGSATAFVDTGASMLTAHTYDVHAVVGSNVSTVKRSVTITPAAAGVWVIDPDDQTTVVLVDAEQGSQDMAEQAVTHAVIGAAPVRRRLGTPPPSGGQTGRLMDALGLTAAASFARLMVWKKQDAGHVYRLVIGDWNIPVTLGDITAAPVPITSTGDLVYVAGFAWQQTDDEVPWG